MRAYQEYKWKENDLYYGDQLCYKITPHEKYQGMWWLINPEGEEVDFYNIQRARDNARKLDQWYYNRSAEEGAPTGATGV